MRTVRIDDYPYGSPKYDKPWCINAVTAVCNAFRKYSAPFIFGVIPFEIDSEDITFLNRIVPAQCSIVMHGFTHGFKSVPDWGKITETWETGGEFSKMSVDTIRELYKKADAVLSKCARYNREHFIAPFNCYTQELVDALNNTPVKYLHTCDKEYDQFGYAKFNYGKIVPVISKYKISYDYASLINRIKDLDDSQITLHWMYDARKPNWQEAYEALCKRIAQNA